MPMHSHATLSHSSSRGEWEMILAAPPPVLRDFVRAYVGWTEYARSPILRRELPTEEVPLIFNFGAPIRIYGAGGAETASAFGSFTTGAYDTYVVVESAGRSAGLQVNLTLLGARLLLRRPLADLTNRTVALEDIFGPEGERLVSELHDAPGWEARFAIVDRELLTRLAIGVPVPDAVGFTWRRLVESGGRNPVGSIVEEVGYSHRHLVALFTEQMGLNPKTLARVLRFGRAVRLIKSGRARTLTGLAHACGYYDQSHFVRDCRSLAGVTPGELVASLLPDGGGFLVDGSNLSKPAEHARA